MQPSHSTGPGEKWGTQLILTLMFLISSIESPLPHRTPWSQVRQLSGFPSEDAPEIPRWPCPFLEEPMVCSIDRGGGEQVITWGAVSLGVPVSSGRSHHGRLFLRL